MARFDKIPPGSRFRAEASDALGGTAGVFGNDDLICVTLDGNGQLIVATATDIRGIILTSEGRRDTHRETAAEQRTVVAGYRYTVMRDGEILDAALFDTPFAAGDRVYATAGGNLNNGAGAIAGDLFVGDIIPREEDSTQLRLVVNIGGAAVAT